MGKLVIAVRKTRLSGKATVADRACPTTSTSDTEKDTRRPDAKAGKTSHLSIAETPRSSVRKIRIQHSERRCWDRIALGDTAPALTK